MARFQLKENDVCSCSPKISAMTTKHQHCFDFKQNILNLSAAGKSVEEIAKAISSVSPTKWVADLRQNVLNHAFTSVCNEVRRTIDDAQTKKPSPIKPKPVKRKKKSKDVLQLDKKSPK